MTNETAYARYHSLYDNNQYQTVTQLAAEELTRKHEKEAAALYRHL